MKLRAKVSLLLRRAKIYFLVSNLHVSTEVSLTLCACEALRPEIVTIIESNLQYHTGHF